MRGTLRKFATHSPRLSDLEQVGNFGEADQFREPRFFATQISLALGEKLSRDDSARIAGAVVDDSERPGGGRGESVCGGYALGVKRDDHTLGLRLD